MALLGNGGDGGKQARGMLLGIYRAVMTAAVLGAGGVMWNASHKLTSIETLLAEQGKRLERHDNRLFWLERSRSAGAGQDHAPTPWSPSPPH